MEIDEKIFTQVIYDAIKDGVKSKFNAYNSPLDKLCNEAIQIHYSEFRSLLEESIKSCINDEKFKEDIKSSTRSILAKILVQRFGGEIEKQVNNLKSDPTTRARITLAIEEIVKG